ncbi:MAG: hypothetical protein A2639_01415 [Candidatus Staskawiczbacteria bacterium RIFCSPHIGHO2_01_FULL_34_27]|uniref:DUF4258 domain-containing protein n=1 Tax=Candidatus Staskawiczbacteria bacterium RIFCSPHIGHO2_01_FULL_34_27 TaxID=1802199 RepID=A0A1G2HKW6_9BACT|nr:MAG: hypothetical protein A2639_01415 [Candidatus Staskawiczbacteria bacterium RIFCSPHIGHO2_01_FULL_34_27]
MALNKKIHWTEHSKIKMRQYGLSKSKITNLLYKPKRKELGIVPGTVALMQDNKSYSKAKTKKAPGEIWLMYKDNKNIRKIISAWRYPGISKRGDSLPIPEDIRQELLGPLNKDFRHEITKFQNENLIE